MFRISRPVFAQASRSLARAGPLSKAQSRFATSSSHPAKEASPHIMFYKTFGGPVFKVFLMATFTYQLAYWAWVKLEKDEIRDERQAEINALESQLQEAIAKSKTP